LEYWNKAVQQIDHSFAFTIADADEKTQQIENKMIGRTDRQETLILDSEQSYNLKFEEQLKVNGLDIAGKNIPYDGIGGDYFDFHWRLDSRRDVFSVAVGDSSGHGLESAPLMLTTRHFIKVRASQPGPISDVISEMNSYIAAHAMATNNFMTLFYLTIDTNRRDILWVRAGHDPALMYHPESKKIEELKGSGVALGIVDDFEYVEHCRNELNDGQIIVIGTDGVWEALNTKGEMFGKQRLCNIIQENAEKSARAILDVGFTALRKFMAGAQLQDDATLVVIKVKGKA
jgi:sigma-B regulation protein RsbU (phosphoserine phosphatase)